MALRTSIAQSIANIQRDFRVVKHRLAREAGLNTSEYELLLTLHALESSLSIKELSNHLLLCSQAITKIAKNLETKDLVTSAKSTHDRRVTYIQLTDKGLSLAEREQSFRESAIAEIIEDLNRSEAEAFMQALGLLENQLNDRLSAPANPTPAVPILNGHH